MKLIGVVFVLFVSFSVCIFGFPYYVAPDVLKEINRNEMLYEQYPTDNKVMFDLAMSYAYSGQILKGWTILKNIPPEYSDSVVTNYEAKIKEDPTQWRYPFKCAFGYFFQGKKVLAIDMFHKVLDLDKNQYWAYGFIALVYGEMGDPEKVVFYCKKGLEIEPNATAIHFLLGEAYRKQKKYFKAFKQILKVGRLQDSSIDHDSN